MLIDNHGVKTGKTSFHGTTIRMWVPSIRINVFHCARGGMAGIIDADFIESNLYAGITAGLGIFMLLQVRIKSGKSIILVLILVST